LLIKRDCVGLSPAPYNIYLLIKNKLLYYFNEEIY